MYLINWSKDQSKQLLFSHTQQMHASSMTERETVLFLLLVFDVHLVSKVWGKHCNKNPLHSDGSPANVSGPEIVCKPGWSYLGREQSARWC